MKYIVSVNRKFEIDVENELFEKIVKKQNNCEDITEEEFNQIKNELEKITGIPVYDYENTDLSKDSISAVYTKDAIESNGWRGVLIEM